MSEMLARMAQMEATLAQAMRLLEAREREVEALRAENVALRRMQMEQQPHAAGAQPGGVMEPPVGSSPQGRAADEDDDEIQ